MPDSVDVAEDPSGLPEGSTRHVLSPRPPFRGYVISGVLSLGGAALIVVASSQGWANAWIALFAVILALGIALALTATWSMLRMRLYVDLDAKGYHIHGAGQDRSGTWDKVTRAALTETRSRLTLYHGQVGRTHIVRPGVGDPAEMDQLAADVAKRLDTSRGYSQNAE
ncbi:MAG: hypothetical protein SOH99_01725 [Acidipropionibacterium acidipropionici]|jgi:hypothetical protein|uniref:PH domain-containing protein n=2 Tax=Acidipropionibacterium acidipropionici TaxID=1748 RepID=A0A142KLY5_9ACTN|nr:hypothetical protein [Acidipropionibacterium acidipropionici]AFV90847.1 Membrane protein without function [Acidipropionibacterium acidipropionici ATCC 4875]ALN15023.1 hypothetical protein ASQ49_06750 [Acidipropionibacterium acidipropionici]AMS07123.1 hypothetical protein AXH35_08450 [Acidipropionibacterium acidipropionici]AOZ48323.1 hypothetical protein A8L58_09895 [Acidipropionibacterium acidipropionici]APZ09224.1 hypothetical protein BWX38_08175 [Acidipropionibacterium acidipropionici]